MKTEDKGEGKGKMKIEDDSNVADDSKVENDSKVSIFLIMTSERMVLINNIRKDKFSFRSFLFFIFLFIHNIAKTYRK